MNALIMLVGLPGSGKSYLAHQISKEYSNVVIHSSDALRLELYNDINDQNHNKEIFTELHKRIKRDLLAGKNVIYDATNINHKKRKAFLQEIETIDCKKICALIICPYELLLIQNKERDKVVSEDVIKRMYLNFTPPCYQEGFDEIKIYYNYHFDKFQKIQAQYTIQSFYKRTKDFNQENQYHKLTLGEHSIKTAEILARRSFKTKHFVSNYSLGLFHDCGKIFTQTKGKDGQCHYYNHQNVGAYDSFLYLSQNPLFTPDDLIAMSNLIYYHMTPYQGEKALNKVGYEMGNGFLYTLMLLHKADEYAH